MNGPADDRPLAVQVAWLASGLVFPDLVDVAEILARDVDDQELVDAWSVCGLPDPMVHRRTAGDR